MRYLIIFAITTQMSKIKISNKWGIIFPIQTIRVLAVVLVTKTRMLTVTHSNMRYALLCYYPGSQRSGASARLFIGSTIRTELSYWYCIIMDVGTRNDCIHVSNFRL